MDIRQSEILRIFPNHIRHLIERTFDVLGSSVQEIRVRSNRPLLVTTQSGSFAVGTDGQPSPAVGGAYITGETDLRLIFQAVCDNSVYAFMDEIRQGFVTIKGGHRIGFSGRVVTDGGRIENFREISSLNIRIAREIIGAADYIIDGVQKPFGVVNTLIISPPLGGKTTVLRDLARQISNSGIRTALADDRGEIAALFKGVPQNDVGVQTDVIENAPKGDGIVMLLRTMSPQLIISDEISTKEDANAILQCFGTGVSVIASAHGGSAEEVLSREALRPLFGETGFQQIIALRKEGHGINTKIFGTITEIG